MRILFILILFFAGSSLYSQDVGWIAKFGLAGGITPVYAFPDFEEFNKQTASFGMEEFPSQGMLSWGGSGFVYILLVKNLRVGGTGFGGTVTRESSIGGYNYEAKYSMGMGAVTVEYTLPFIQGFNVSVGTMLGVGNVKMEMYKNNSEFDWDNIFNEFNGNTDSFSRVMKNSFYTISPTLNIEIPLNRLAVVRIGGGYIFSLGDEWTVENDVKLNNVPEGLSSNSFYLQTGLLIGIFAF